MLGLIKSNQSQSWMWAAYGKHPAIKDYFRVGQDFPLLRVFASWVENGYKQFSPSKDKAMQNSWHFWARGAASDSIVCGVVKDSSDGIGRNYPLLIIGTGPLREWSENWDLLPLACEAVWLEIEHIAIRPFDDLKKLKADVRSIRQPQSDWRELVSKKNTFQEDPDAFQNVPDLLAGRKESFIPLDQRSHQDQNLLICHWHSLFKNSVKIIPNVVFMGESLGRFFLRFYKRPLTPMDFIHLWKAGQDPERCQPIRLADG